MLWRSRWNGISLLPWALACYPSFVHSSAVVLTWQLLESHICDYLQLEELDFQSWQGTCTPGKSNSLFVLLVSVVASLIKPKELCSEEPQVALKSLSKYHCRSTYELANLGIHSLSILLNSEVEMEVWICLVHQVSCCSPGMSEVLVAMPYSGGIIPIQLACRILCLYSVEQGLTHPKGQVSMVPGSFFFVPSIFSNYFIVVLVILRRSSCFFVISHQYVLLYDIKMHMHD